MSINLATGQNAQGVVQTTGDQADANWTVTNADNYQDAPIAYTVTPGDADWFSGWLPGSSKSSWIAADPNNAAQGDMTFTFNFSLAGYNPADATLVGGLVAIDDVGEVFLNGHVIGATPYPGWSPFTTLSNGAGDFVSGENTIVIQITSTDNYLEGVNLEGEIEDSTPLITTTSFHWANAVAGDFSNAADWNTGAVPQSADDAILDPAGAKFIVTSSADESVNTIQTAANATLSITAGTFSAAVGTGYDGGVNACTIALGAGATLDVAGVVDNTGMISLGAGGAGLADIVVSSKGLGITGTGGILFTQSGTAPAVAEITGGPLTNSGNTLSGQVDIDVGRLTNDSGGVIDASGKGQLYLTTQVKGAPNAINNSGLIESTASTSVFATPLIVSCNVLNNYQGTISAAKNSAIDLGQVAIVSGGTLTGAGKIYVGRATGGTRDVVSGRTATLTNDASLVVRDGDLVTLTGSIVNNGSVLIDSSGDPTYLDVAEVNTTLTGGGSIELSDNADNFVTGAEAGVTLINGGNVISGAGSFGAGDISIDNYAGGIFDATGLNALAIDTGSYSFANAGLLEATGKGGLAIKSSTVANATGTILAANLRTVDLDGVDIQGGILEAAGSGQITFSGTTDEVDGSTQAVDMSGKIVVLAGAYLTGVGSLETDNSFICKGVASLQDGVVNNGTLESAGGTVTVAGAVTGSGQVRIEGGELSFGGAFDQEVVFRGAGELALGDSQAYGGTVWGFTTSGTDSLDLEDIAFAGATVSFSGGASQGVLTVTSGAEVANITLKGNFLTSTFTLSEDASGGTIVTDPKAAAPALAQAMATFSPSPATTVIAHDAFRPDLHAAAMLALTSFR